jgi:aspartokinase/homoserine dehydrogenase 1
MKILKFGGSSVGTPDRIRGVKKIVESDKEARIVVVSAFRGVTDQLQQISELASQRKEDYKSEMAELRSRHNEAINFLIPAESREQVLTTVNGMLDELEMTLSGVFLLQELSRKTLDLLMSYGERLSAYIISFIINDAQYVDVRYLIKTDDSYGNGTVQFDLTNILLKNELSSLTKIAVIPGFIGSNNLNETTTLGRGGSDYTAAIVAAALDADSLEIWTDVDGFMTADPKKVEKAYPISHLTYTEALELSHFGAKVVYTPTLRPVYKKSIPVWIKNTFNPEATGTLINNLPDENFRSPIKGISSIDHVDLISLQGTAMMGVSGTSMRLFSALAKAKANVILITQASSEYSITFAVSPSESRRAERAIHSEFHHEIEVNKDLRLVLEKDLSVIAIVGEGMKNTPGISATLFRSLGKNGINIIATAQGSSELNISVVIRNSSLKKALNVIHEGFFLSEFKEINLFIAGTGTVGQSLLQQIHKQQSTLAESHRLKVNLVGITNSRKMLIEKKHINPLRAIEMLTSAGDKTDLCEFHNQIVKLNLQNAVFIDCTGSQQVSDLYYDMLNSFVSVVTANKIACSSDFEHYKNLKATAKKRNVRFLYETNVGAGLPIINTINDLILSGDRILKLQAVLSGTLNFIFNELSAEVPMSETIRRAKEKGYSEPDPRIDLSGTDVVRKILILSREAGYPLEKSDVSTKPFLPAECFEGSIDEFWEKVKKYDVDFEERRAALASKGKRWRFFATLNEGKASVELLEVDQSHPSFALEGSNNIILITTERYKELPMVIKGYGAGAEVTAAGVFADIIRVANV